MDDLNTLSERATNARMKWEMLGMRNTYGLTAEERIKLDQDYAQAAKEMHEANLAVLRATGMRATGMPSQRDAPSSQGGCWVEGDPSPYE